MGGEAREPDGKLPEDPASATVWALPRTSEEAEVTARREEREAAEAQKYDDRARQHSSATTGATATLNGLSQQTTPQNEQETIAEKAGARGRSTRPYANVSADHASTDSSDIDLEAGRKQEPQSPQLNRPHALRAASVHHDFGRTTGYEDHDAPDDDHERLELPELTRKLTRTPTAVRAKDSEGRYIISWSKGNDPENPKNWPRRKKMVNVFIISLMALLCPMSSSIMSPGLPQIQHDFNTNETLAALSVSIFVIGFGVGPLLIAPISETIGRRSIYLVCFPIFAVCQIPCALAKNLAMLIVFRFISGFFGSAGIACGGGTISDMFDARERTPIVGKYVLGILIGPAVAPVIGGFTVQGLSWRWTFWIMLIMASVNSLVAIFFLHESYAPKLLEERAKRMAVELDHPTIAADHDPRDLRTRLFVAVKRPMKILFLQPIVFLLASYMALIYGTLYAEFTTFPTVFRNQYGFSEGIIGLVYLAPGLGFLAAIVVGVPQIQSWYLKLADRQPDKQGKPEFRMPVANVGAVLVPMGLFWYGWSVEYRNFWLVPLIGNFFFGAGMIVLFQAINNYYIDGFARYAASAIAAGSIFRAVVGAVFPLWVPFMYDALGYGWGTSVLGLAAVLIMPAPYLIMRYGERLRTKFKVDLD